MGFETINISNTFLEAKSYILPLWSKIRSKIGVCPYTGMCTSTSNAVSHFLWSTKLIINTASKTRENMFQNPSQIGILNTEKFKSSLYGTSALGYGGRHLGSEQ